MNVKIYVRDILRPEILKTVYYVKVQSILQHGIIGWEGAYESIRNPLKFNDK